MSDGVSKEFRVILMSGTFVFRCVTVLVSAGGMTLNSAVPARFSQSTCTAYISKKGKSENLELPCEVVADASGSSEIRFVNPDLPEIKLLSEWIQS